MIYFVPQEEVARETTGGLKLGLGSGFGDRKSSEEASTFREVEQEEGAGVPVYRSIDGLTVEELPFKF